MRMLFLQQCVTSGVRVLKGWTSIWLTAGLMRGLEARSSSIWRRERQELRTKS